MNCKIGIIGFGSMGRMIFEKLISSKIVQGGDIYIANRTYEKIREVNSKYPEVNVCRRNYRRRNKDYS